MIEQIVSLLDEGNILVALVLIFIGFVLNMGNLIAGYESLRRRKISALKEAISTKEISPGLQKNFETELENEYFRLIYGAYITPRLRSGLLTVYESLAGEIAFRHFVRAHDYLRQEADDLRVELNWKAYLSHGYNIIGGGVVLILGIFLILLLLLALSTGQMAKQMLYTLLLAILFIFLGAGMVLSARPLISARILRTALNKDI